MSDRMDQFFETTTFIDERSHRNPYVGEGADGARRSAQIDREEADGLDADDERYLRLLNSAERWERQATDLELAEFSRDTPVLTADENAADWPPYLVWGYATVRVEESDEPGEGLHIPHFERVALPPALVHATTWTSAESCYKASVATPPGTTTVSCEVREPRKRREAEEAMRRHPSGKRPRLTVIDGGRSQ